MTDSWGGIEIDLSEDDLSSSGTADIDLDGNFTQNFPVLTADVANHNATIIE
jgi:hypothetical protein